MGNLQKAKLFEIPIASGAGIQLSLRGKITKLVVDQGMADGWIDARMRRARCWGLGTGYNTVCVITLVFYGVILNTTQWCLAMSWHYFFTTLFDFT